MGAANSGRQSKEEEHRLYIESRPLEGSDRLERHWQVHTHELRQGATLETAYWLLWVWRTRAASTVQAQRLLPGGRYGWDYLPDHPTSLFTAFSID